MLSILIPTYNYNCLDLVSKLNEQASKLQINYEIIVLDDCSTNHFEENQAISNLPNCNYGKLEKNIGRAQIRNLLAEKAKYAYLLFLDCDAEICSENFIQAYINCCTEENLVACGGRLYEKTGPKNKELFLHWLYGSKREVISVIDRQKDPNRSFMSNNFLISKNLFLKIRFNETIHKYGHEDTLFGLELKKHNIKITHIDNPLIHIGLDKAAQIIQKEKDSVQNLLLICNTILSFEAMASEIKLLRYAKTIENLQLSNFMCLVFKVSSKLIEKNLKGNHPFIFLMDIYKLSYFFYLKKEAKN